MPNPKAPKNAPPGKPPTPASQPLHRSPGLQDVLVQAKVCALRFGRKAITPELILVGILRTDAGIAEQMLQNMKVDKARLRADFEGEIGLAGFVLLDSETQRTLEFVDEVAAKGERYQQEFMSKLSSTMEEFEKFRASMQVQLEAMERALEELKRRVSVYKVPFDLDAEQLLASAEGVARELNCNWVDSGNLLVALSRAKGTPASQALNRAGIDPERAMRVLQEIYNGPPESA